MRFSVWLVCFRAQVALCTIFFLLIFLGAFLRFVRDLSQGLFSYSHPPGILWLVEHLIPLGLEIIISDLIYLLKDYYQEPVRKSLAFNLARRD